MPSTASRPCCGRAAGSLLAASVLWQVSDPLTALALGVAVGAPTALVPHAAKSPLRVVSTTFTGGLANPVQHLEDVMAVSLVRPDRRLPVVVAATLLVITGSWWHGDSCDALPSAARR